MSLPRPPSSTSSPRMPRRMSSPPRPMSRSFARVPLSMSGPSVPVKSASPGWTRRARPAAGDLHRPQPRARWPRRGPRPSCARCRSRRGGCRRATRSPGRGRRRSAGGAPRGAWRGPRARPCGGSRAASRRARRSRRAVGRDAEPAAAVGAQRDRGADAAGAGVDAHDARGGPRLPLPGVVAQTHAWPAESSADARGARDGEPRTRRPVARSSTATLPPAWTTRPRGLGDRQSIGVPAACARLSARGRDVDRSRSRPCARPQPCVPSAVTASASGAPA